MGIRNALQFATTRQTAIDLAKGRDETGNKAVALAIVYLADVIKEGNQK